MTHESARTKQCIDPNLLVLLGNCREGHDVPALLLEYMAHEIILVKSLHNQNNDIALLVVEPTDQGVVVPLIREATLSLGQGLFRLQRIINDDHVAPSPGQHSANR